MKLNIKQKLISKFFIFIILTNTLFVPARFFYQSSEMIYKNIERIGYQFLFNHGLDYEVNGFNLLWEVDLPRYLVQLLLLISIYFLLIKIYE